MFRVSSHPSSEVHETLNTASGIGHIIGAAPMIRPIPEAVITPDDGCDDIRDTWSDLAVNTYTGNFRVSLDNY